MPISRPRHSSHQRSKSDSSLATYRPDIDGLRAVAILSVVFYHAFPPVFRGGFVGVDIFFVISGFLISTVIFQSLQRGEFSFFGFYARRIKRIFPALMLVLAASLAFGWIALLADEFMQLGKHMAASAAFLENLVLLREAGYFDTSSALKPLMHLWSLAIEEQFYLIWPFLLWGSWRLERRSAGLVLVIGAASFGLNVLEVHKDAVVAFFSPQTRFWELVFGAILAYLQLFKPDQLRMCLARICFPLTRLMRSQESDSLNAVQNSFLSLCGMFLILSAVFGLRDGQHFPGWLALLPVVGSFLLLLAGPNAWVNRKLLANRIMIAIGLMSYPLYLWHWPLLSFLQILESEAPSSTMRLAAVGISFLLAWLTFLLVERPIRRSRHTLLVTCTLCLVIAALGFAGLMTYRANGFASRSVVKLNSRITPIGMAIYPDYIVNGCGIEDPDTMKKFANCVSDSRGAAKFALLGDSKAAALAPGILEASDSSNPWVFIGGNGPNSAPVPIISDSPIYARYQSQIKTAVESIARNKSIRVVVITAATRSLFDLTSYEDIQELSSSANFDVALAGLKRVVAALAASGKKVVLTVDNPTLKDPRFCINRITSSQPVNLLLNLGSQKPCLVELDTQIRLSERYRSLLSAIQADFPNQVRVFDTLEQLCDMDHRVCSSSMNDRLLYKYTDHISEYASRRIAAQLIPFVENFADEDPR